MTLQAYHDFLRAKAAVAPPVGFDRPTSALPHGMKPFQSAVTTWALKRGCAALLEGTGLGRDAERQRGAQTLFDMAEPA